MSPPTNFLDLRREMVAEQLASRGVRDPRVLDAFLKAPRHLFVGEDDVDRAYLDRPLPIGHGQTISQPFIVALTLQLARLQGDERVLEIGTGSGYQTFLLSQLAREVYTVERIAALADRARTLLEALGCANVRFRVGDGSLGWPEEAPYEAIVVSAGAPEMPPALKEQLKVGGRLVAPVGGEEQQTLTVLTRTATGWETSNGGPCLFVKLIGEGGWRERRPEER
jgi:protein-L-isoaspartate(D-aspartate) O-methyltransferase